MCVVGAELFFTSTYAIVLTKLAPGEPLSLVQVGLYGQVNSRRAFEVQEGFLWVGKSKSRFLIALENHTRIELGFQIALFFPLFAFSTSSPHLSPGTVRMERKKPV